MIEKKQDALNKGWTQLCHELEQAKRDYEAAEAAIAESCGAAPKKGGEAEHTNDAVKASIEANLRKVEILRQMRRFISNLD